MIRVEVMKFSNIHCFGPQNLWQPAGNQIPEYLLQGCLAAFKSRTETDVRKEDRVIFMLISRTNFSRNFGVPPSDGTVEMGTDYHQLLFDGQ
jgi:hypothetical protein